LLAPIAAGKKLLASLGAASKLLVPLVTASKLLAPLVASKLLALVALKMLAPLVASSKETFLFFCLLVLGFAFFFRFVTTMVEDLWEANEKQMVSAHDACSMNTKFETYLCDFPLNFD
jgi:hypothetical protein